MIVLSTGWDKAGGHQQVPCCPTFVLEQQQVALWSWIKHISGAPTVLWSDENRQTVLVWAGTARTVHCLTAAEWLGPGACRRHCCRKLWLEMHFKMFKDSFILYAILDRYQYFSIAFFSLIAKWQSLRGNCNRLLWSLAVIYPKVWKATLEYRTTSGKYVGLLIWSEIKNSQGQERLTLALQLFRMIRKQAFFSFFFLPSLLTTAFFAMCGTMPLWYIGSRYTPFLKDCGR